MQATFEIILEQPVILSQQAASAGAHQSLDYIPGSTLLGLAASRLYANLDTDSAWLLFHSGRARFQDALPLHQGETGHPVPLCWHSWKGESARDGDRLDSRRLFNPAHPDFANEPGRQPVQLRSGYVTSSGLLIEPLQQQTLKTAIDRSSGMAAESQLFGYEALSPGQCFRFDLQADDDLPTDLWQQLVQAISGPARLGRSRSAQFGQVRISLQADGALSSPACAGNHLTLWLLSDLLLEDQGQPCLRPDAQLLGLPTGSQWLAEHSFLRSRRYSPYNAYRRSYDAERQVICRGSVLRYALPRGLRADELHELECGLGLQIESGLGRAWVNPPLLSGAQPAFAAGKPASAASAAAQAPRPDSLLIRTLEMRRQRRSGDDEAAVLAQQIYHGLCQRIRQARVFTGTPANTPLSNTPNRSQWGRLKELASDQRNDARRLLNALTGETDGVLRPRKDGPWTLRYAPGEQHTLGHWLTTALQEQAGKACFTRLVGHLAVLGLQQSWLNCCAGSEHKESVA